MTEPAPRPTPAEVYERSFVPGIFGPLSRILVRLAAPGRGDDVLDLATGTGVVARAVAPLVGPEGRVVAVDLRPPMIAVARSRRAPEGATIEWREGDATQLDLPDASFDLVLCQQGLQFFNPREEALRHIRRVLRPGGRFAAAVWQGIEQQPLFHALAPVETRHVARLGLTWEDVVFPFLQGDADAIRDAIERAGFVDVETSGETIEIDFDAATFVADIEYGYAGVVPEFIANPAAHAEFVSAVERDAADALAEFRVGDRIRAPMSTNLFLARAA